MAEEVKVPGAELSWNMIHPMSQTVNQYSTCRLPASGEQEQERLLLTGEPFTRWEPPAGLRPAHILTL